MTFTVLDDDPRPAIFSNMSIIGLVGVSPLADAGIFPVNTPVTLESDDADMLASLGTTGTLYDAIAAVNNQLGEFQVAAQVVVVRVAAGGTTAQTIANLVGDVNAKTGLYSLIDAPEELGVTPRLIAVPGYTSQALNQIASATITTRGTGYTTAPTVAISGGGGTGGAATSTISKGIGSMTVGAGGTGYTTPPTVSIPAPDQPGGIQAVAHAVLTSNAVSSIVVDTVGKGYSVAPTITLTGGGGTGAAVTAVLTGVLDTIVFSDKGQNFTTAPTLTLSGGGGTGGAATAVLDTATNAVCAALPTVLDQLFAVAVVDGPSTNQTAALAWRSSMSSKRLIPVDPYVKILDIDGVSIITTPTSPYVLGLGVKVDHQYGGRPFHSFANQAINGIVGAARPIGFSILDGATEGQTLLANNVGIVVRGEATDTAIADGGYVFIGTDTTSADTLWKFYNQVRGRDYIHLMFIKTLRFYLGRYNLTKHTVQAVLNTMNSALAQLQATDDILGFRCEFQADKNSPDELRLGRFTLGFYAEEAAPLVGMTIESRRYRPALDALVADLVANVDAIAA